MEIDPSKYGVFANIVAVAASLVATFSVLLLNSLGKINRWTWLIDDSPSLIVTGGARALTIALMVITYITIDKYNYGYFGVVAIICGAANLYFINKFNLLRREHVAKIPIVAQNGMQATDAKGQLLYNNIVIGSEDDMNEDSKKAYLKARKDKGGVSLEKFMSGYGNPVNDPKSIWPNKLIAKLGNDLTLSLMCIVLLAVLTLYLAAFVVEVYNR